MKGETGKRGDEYKKQRRTGHRVRLRYHHKIFTANVCHRWLITNFAFYKSTKTLCTFNQCSCTCAVKGSIIALRLVILKSLHSYSTSWLRWIRKTRTLIMVLIMSEKRLWGNYFTSFSSLEVNTDFQMNLCKNNIYIQTLSGSHWSFLFVDSPVLD